MFAYGATTVPEFDLFPLNIQSTTPLIQFLSIQYRSQASLALLFHMPRIVGQGRWAGVLDTSAADTWSGVCFPIRPTKVLQAALAIMNTYDIWL